MKQARAIAVLYAAILMDFDAMAADSVKPGAAGMDATAVQRLQGAQAAAGRSVGKTQKPADRPRVAGKRVKTRVKAAPVDLGCTTTD